MSMGLEQSNSVDLEGWIEEAENDIENTVKEIARLFFVYQSDETVGQVPVDTGRYRSSWNVAVNEKDESHPDVNDDGPFGKPQFTIQGNFELGDTIVINNSIPYLGRLNYEKDDDGSFVNDPIDPGFIEENIQSALQRIEGI